MQKQCLDDCCYDTVNQLAHTLNFLGRADHYIEDANRIGEKHADMLKELVKNEVRNNKF